MNEDERDEGTNRPGAAAPVNEEPFDEETVDAEMDEPMHAERASTTGGVGDDADGTPRRKESARAVRAGDEDDGLPFWGNGQADEYRSRWTDIQTGFVDDPKKAIQQADELLEKTIRSLTDGFNSRRSTLRQDWEGNGELSTEDLRVSMKRYRSFLDGLLGLEP